ncbi:MAG: hypothetical protein PHH85_09015 [Candidatus Methanoperedens sp.]|nr:hypothetical protein [Candidatus Methanoperedens sp.]
MKLKEAILKAKERLKKERSKANNAKRVMIEGKQVRPKRVLIMKVWVNGQYVKTIRSDESESP